MESQVESITLMSDGKSVTTTPEIMEKAIDAIPHSLVIKGAYKGLAHKEIDSMMQYAIKIKVEHPLDRVRVYDVIYARHCTVAYRVPAVSKEIVQLGGMIDSARPDDGEGIWLKGNDPDYVTFTIHHTANGAQKEIAKLMTLLHFPDLTLEARFVPLQGRLL